MAGAARQRFLNDAEMRLLLLAPNEPRWRVLIALMLFGGLRLSEALGLRWQDVDFAEGLIHVRNQLRYGPTRTAAGSRA